MVGQYHFHEQKDCLSHQKKIPTYENIIKMYHYLLRPRMLQNWDGKDSFRNFPINELSTFMN